MLLYKIVASHSELKSIDDDFPIFEMDQNKPIDVRPSTSRALILQEPVIYFDQLAEDPTKYICSRHRQPRTEVHALACTFCQVMAGRIAVAAIVSLRVRRSR